MQYYKFSDERSRKYSICTSVLIDGERKSVIKTPIYPDGMRHLENIVLYAKILSAAYPKMGICPVRLEKDRIVFDFIKGSLLLDEYEDCFRRNDREAYLEVIKKHYQMICGSEENKEAFESTEQAEKYFGNLSDFKGKTAIKIANYDAIASNIVMGVKPYFIDYEWVFDCGLPLDLVVFHCIGDAYLHFKELEEFMPLKEVMEFLKVKTPIGRMEECYHNFYRQVIGEAEGICFANKKYECLCEERQIKTLQEELVHAKKEWKLTADRWKGSCEENDKLERRVDELLHENAKLNQYWQDSCKEYRKPVAQEHTIENLNREISGLNQTIEDKNQRIQNIEALLEKSRAEYNQIIQSKRWWLVSKVARIFHR